MSERTSTVHAEIEIKTSRNCAVYICYNLLELLLRAQLIRVTTLLLSTVGRTGRQTSVTLTTDHLVTVVLSGQHLQRRLNSTTSKTKNQVQSRLLLDVIVAQSSTVFQLLSSENQSLLVRWDTFLILDLGLDILNSVRGLYIEGDGLTC